MSGMGKNAQLVVDLNAGYIYHRRASGSTCALSGTLKIPDGIISELFRKKSGAPGFADFCSTNAAPTGKAIVLLPARLGAVKFFTLPAADDSEISAMVDFEAAGHLPSGTDWNWSFQPRRTSASSNVDIALHSIRKQMLSNCLENIRAAGIEPVRVYPFSAGAQFLANALAASLFGKVIAFLFAGEKEMTLSVQENGLLRYSRAFAPDSVQETINEVSLSIDDFQSGGKHVVDSLYIFGDHGYEKELAALLGEKLRAQVRGMGWSDIDFAELRSTGANDELTVTSALAASAAAAGSRNGDAARLDVMPRPSATQKKRRRGKFAAWAGAALVLLLVIGAVTFAARKTADYSHKISSLEKQIAKLEPTVDQINSMQAKLAAYSDARQSASPLDIIRELTLVMPEKDIKITRFFYEKEGRVSIAGQAKSHSEVMTLIAEMNHSDVFSDTHLDFSRRSTEYSIDIVNFEISAAVEPGGEQ